MKEEPSNNSRAPRDAHACGAGVGGFKAPVAIVSVRSGPASDDYRGIAVSVPAQHIRLRVRGSDMRADLKRALGVCQAAGWTPTFTEATKRASPEIALHALAETSDAAR